MFIVGIGCVSAESIDEIGISSSDDVTDDIVAVSDDVSVDDVVAEIDSVDDSISVENDKNLESVDDSGNESLAVQDEEPVNDVGELDSALVAENDNGETLGTVLDPKNLSGDDFATPDTIYYLNAGTYTVNQLYGMPIGAVYDSDYNMNFINNIEIKAKDNADVVINVVSTANKPSGIIIYGGNNITIENIKFTGSQSGMELLSISAASNVTIKNCTFENISHQESCCRIENYNSGDIIDNVLFEDCKFINVTSTLNSIVDISNRNSAGGVNSIYFKNCNFENCSAPRKNNALLNIETGKLFLENNNFDSNKFFIRVSNSGLISEPSFNVLTKSLTFGVSSSIVGELVDDNGNHIYSPNLKFIISDEEKTPSFDSNTGLYSFSYVPTESQVSVRAVCSNVEYLDAETVSLPVKTSSDLSINSTQSITYGEELIIVNATLNETITNENVTFTLKDSSGNVIKSVDALITNGFANSSFVEKLLPGTYTISAIYAGNEEFGESSVSAQLTVNKLTGYINVTANNVTVFDDVIVTFTMPEEVNGKLELIRIGCLYNPSGFTNGIAFRENIAVINGTASVNFGRLAANDDVQYVYAIAYNFISSNPLYSSINTHGYWTSSNRNLLPQFKVLKVDSIPVIDVNDICLGDNATISVSGLAETATGTVTYYVDDGEAVVKNIGETFTVEGLGVGEHNVRVVYSGDANYSANETSATFNVFTIALESYDLDYDENVAVVAVLPDGAEGMLGIEVDGIDPVSAQVVNGSAAFELSGLKPGNYTLHMAYQGTPINLHADVDVTVIPKITNVDDLNTVYNAIGIDLPSDATGSLTVTVDGNTTIVVPVENGTAKCTIENLTAGEHEITVAYEGNYPSYSSTQTVNVAKVTPEGKVNAPASITAGSAVTVPIELPSDASGIVLVDVDGKKYYAEVVNGTANVDIAGLTAGDKVLTYKYLGDDKYNGFTANTTLKVTEEPVVPAKVATKITAPKVSAVYNVAKNLVITLTDKDGKALANKKVTVKVGTISKTLTTNAKGQVSLNVATLVPKTYTATIKFAGDDAYLASSVSPKVVVSKAKPKITAKAKTFKVKVKTKKYTVTLKNNKGKVMKKVKLTLKVGKKTYKATTNSKGKATFKITKLTKKGKYTATVKFAGSKYYKATSKKVKITVKK